MGKRAFPSLACGGVGGLLLSLLSPFAAVVTGLVLAGAALGQLRAGWREEAAAGEPQGQSSRPALSNAARRAALLLKSPAVLTLAGLVLGAAPLMLYAYWIVQVHPVLAGWNAQNITPTPPAWDILLSLSPALFFAAYETWSIRKRIGLCGKETRLILWGVIGLGLIFLPLNLQLRFIIGLYIPIAGLAAAGIERLAQGDPRRRRNLAASVFIFTLPGLLLLQLAVWSSVQNHNRTVFLSDGEDLALRWIDRQTPRNALILAGPDTGLFIPARTARRVIYGHPYETVNAAGEEAAVEAFYQAGGWQDAQRRELLAGRKIDYVFYGPRERALGKPGILSELRLVYAEAGVEIYETK